MAAVFESILRMSAVGSIVIIAVLTVRLCLKKAPKLYSYLLWAIVLLRLLCPFTVESPLSLIPDKLSSETAAQELSTDYIWPSTKLYSDESGFETAVDAGAEVCYTDTGDSYVNLSLGSPFPSPSSGLDLMTVLAAVWLCGVAAMAAWSIAGYIKLKQRLRGAMVCDNGVYLSYKVDTPFVLGFFLPKIYLPGDISAEEWEYIVMHERCHIRRGDHVTRVLAFAALALHWFNPLVWLAFILSGRDMEMSCDEAVIRTLGPQVRGDYSASLLSLATGRPMLSAMPLAFGEGDPKGRIRNLAKWRKPTVWIIIIAVLICAAAAVCLLTDPLEREAQIRVNGRVYTYVGSEEMPIGQVWELGMLEGIVHRSGEEPEKDFYGTNLDEKYAGQPLYAGLDGRIYLFDEDGFFLPFELSEGEVVSGPINSETELGLSGLLAEIEPGDISDDGHYYRNDFQPETLAEAMNALGEPADAVFSGGIADWSYSFSIDGETDGAKKLCLNCGLSENLVQIVLEIGDKQQAAVYKDKALYTLLRHSRDVESSIDPYISREVNAAAEALMQKGLEEYAGNPAQFVEAELTVLSPHSGYVRDDGSEVELYDFAYALIPSKPENLIIAGGAVMDGDLRVHGTGVSYMAVEYRGGRVVKYAPLWGGYFFPEGGLDAEYKEIIENTLSSGFDVTLRDPIIDDGSSAVIGPIKSAYIEAEPGSEEKICREALEKVLAAESAQITKMYGLGNITNRVTLLYEGDDWYWSDSGQGYSTGIVCVDGDYCAYEQAGGEAQWERCEKTPIIMPNPFALNDYPREFTGREEAEAGYYMLHFTADPVAAGLPNASDAAGNVKESFMFSADGELVSISRRVQLSVGDGAGEQEYIETIAVEYYASGALTEPIMAHYTSCINSIAARQNAVTENPVQDNGSEVIAVPYGESLVIDLDGDGIEDVLNMEAGISGVWSLSVNGEELFSQVKSYVSQFNTAEKSRYPDYYVLRTYEGDCSPKICVYDGGPSGDPITHIFTYFRSLQYVGSIPCHPSKMTLAGNHLVSGPARLRVFQTWYSEHTWEIPSNGTKLRQVERDFYYVEDFEFISYHIGDTYYPQSKYGPLLCDVYAYEKMDISADAEVLKEGTELSILGTDNAEWILVADRSGEEYYLHLSGINAYSIDTPQGEAMGNAVFHGLHYFD